MPKPITIEQLEAMSLDQRMTLHQNALALDTSAARQVIELLTTNDLMRRPPSKSGESKSGASKSGASKTAAAKPRVAKKKVASHGRQT